MKISVITVCFNSENTIADTIASVASQNVENWEHIVVDGASTDGTIEIVKNARSVTRFISEPDQGIYDAINKGIRLCQGDIIGILNSDDVYSDFDVLNRVKAVMENRAVDLIYGDVDFFSPDDPGIIKRRFSSSAFSPSRIAWGWMPAHPSIFVRRSVFKRFGLYKTDYKIAGDYEFVARIFRDENIRYVYMQEVLVKMRMGGVSTKGWKNTILLNQEVLRACRENGINTNWLKILSKYPFKVLEYFRYLR